MKFLSVVIVLSFGFVLGQDVPTLYPVNPFDPAADANALFRALDGLGVNENNIVDVLCYRTASQRDVITTTYNNQHGSLLTDLEGDLNGNIETLTVMLIHNMAKFLAIELNDIMARPGTDEPSLTEVMMSRSNQELKDIESIYTTYFGRTLLSDIQADTSGSYRNLMSQMASGQRDESNVVDMTIVETDAIGLYEGGPMISGTDEALYINVFTLRNFAHINQVSITYEAMYGRPLSIVVTEEFRDEMANALVGILQYSKDKGTYFSTRFQTSLAGFGTADRDLMRLTVSRCEIDLGNIKTAYQALYGQALVDAVKADTSGSYQDALVALLG